MHLEALVVEAELHVVIKSAPKEKSPRPHGFIGIFFSLCWEIIKRDLMTAVEQFLTMNQ
jgi:hypothetical protein